MSDTTHPHKLVDRDGRVLLLKCLNRDGTSYGGFVWPKAGPVKPEKWSREPDCDTGGLFGWPWAYGMGEGKDPRADVPWVVFAAKPENVIPLAYGKCKAVPGEDGSLPEVVYYGCMAGAFRSLHMHAGWRLGDPASVSAPRAYDEIAHVKRTAACFETGLVAAAFQDYAVAVARGDHGAAGVCGVHSVGVAYHGTVHASGFNSVAVLAGCGGVAKTTDETSVAVAVADNPELDIARHGIGVTTSPSAWWTVRKGAVLVQHVANGVNTTTHVLRADDLGLPDGTIVYVIDGKLGRTIQPTTEATNAKG